MRCTAGLAFHLVGRNDVFGINPARALSGSFTPLRIIDGNHRQPYSEHESAQCCDNKHLSHKVRDRGLNSTHDDSADAQFAQFHQAPMTGTDIFQFNSNVETLGWELFPSSELEYNSQVNSSYHQIELIWVMRQDQAITCFVKILAGQTH